MWQAWVALTVIAWSGVHAQGPVLNPVADQFCDIGNTQPCTEVSFTGTGFSQSDTYTCAFTRYILTNAGELEESTNHTVAATFVDVTRVDCAMPTSSVVVALESAQFGQLGDQVALLIFPKLCLTCMSDLTCTLTGNGCFVDGVCFSPYDKIGDKFCIPDMSTTGGSTPPSLKLVFDSCSRQHTGEINLIPTTEPGSGYELVAGTLSPLSSRIAFQMVARFPCSETTQERLILSIAPGIKVYQESVHAIRFDLQFTDCASGSAAVFKQFKFTVKDKKCESKKNKKDYRGWIGFLFDSSSSVARFFVQTRKVKEETLSGLCLKTTEEFFISDEQYACVDLSTTIPDLTATGGRLRRKDTTCRAEGKKVKWGKYGCPNST